MVIPVQNVVFTASSVLGAAFQTAAVAPARPNPAMDAFTAGPPPDNAGSALFNNAMRFSDRAPRGAGLATGMRVSLEQSIRQELSINISMRSISDMWGDIYGTADIRRYQRHGLDFEYAVVKRRECPYLLAIGSAGISTDEGQFVMGDFFVHLTPEQREMFMELIAVHEYGEKIFVNHHDASLLEFAVAKEEGVLEEYLAFLEANYFLKFRDVSLRRMGKELAEALEEAGANVTDGDALTSKGEGPTAAADDPSVAVARCLKDGFRWPEELHGQYHNALDEDEEAAREKMEHWANLIIIGEQARSYLMLAEDAVADSVRRRDRRGFQEVFCTALFPFAEELEEGTFDPEYLNADFLSGLQEGIYGRLKTALRIESHPFFETDILSHITRLRGAVAFQGEAGRLLKDIEDKKTAFEGPTRELARVRTAHVLLRDLAHVAQNLGEKFTAIDDGVMQGIVNRRIAEVSKAVGRRHAVVAVDVGALRKKYGRDLSNVKPDELKRQYRRKLIAAYRGADTADVKDEITTAVAGEAGRNGHLTVADVLNLVKETGGERAFPEDLALKLLKETNVHWGTVESPKVHPLVAKYFSLTDEQMATVFNLRELRCVSESYGDHMLVWKALKLDAGRFEALVDRVLLHPSKKGKGAAVQKEIQTELIEQGVRLEDVEGALELETGYRETIDEAFVPPDSDQFILRLASLDDFDGLTSVSEYLSGSPRAMIAVELLPEFDEQRRRHMDEGAVPAEPTVFDPQVLIGLQDGSGIDARALTSYYRRLLQWKTGIGEGFESSALRDQRVAEAFKDSGVPVFEELVSEFLASDRPIDRMGSLTTKEAKWYHLEAARGRWESFPQLLGHYKTIVAHLEADMKAGNDLSKMVVEIERVRADFESLKDTAKLDVWTDRTAERSFHEWVSLSSRFDRISLAARKMAGAKDRVPIAVANIEDFRSAQFFGDAFDGVSRLEGGQQDEIVLEVLVNKKRRGGVITSASAVAVGKETKETNHSKLWIRRLTGGKFQLVKTGGGSSDELASVLRQNPSFVKLGGFPVGEFRTVTADDLDESFARVGARDDMLWFVDAGDSGGGLSFREAPAEGGSQTQELWLWLHRTGPQSFEVSNVSRRMSPEFLSSLLESQAARSGSLTFKRSVLNYIRLRKEGLASIGPEDFETFFREVGQRTGRRVDELVLRFTRGRYSGGLVQWKVMPAGGRSPKHGWEALQFRRLAGGGFGIVAPNAGGASTWQAFRYLADHNPHVRGENPSVRII